jgi:hypothetical protein
MLSFEPLRARLDHIGDDTGFVRRVTPLVHYRHKLARPANPLYEPVILPPDRLLKSYCEI